MPRRNSSVGGRSRPAPHRKKGRTPAHRPRTTYAEREELEQTVAKAVPAVERDRLTKGLEKYLDEIRSWNSRGNLVAPGDLGRLVGRHVAESLAVLPIVDEIAPTTMLDIGSGGGFPAVPIKLARPAIAVAMVESRRLKALFLRRVVKELGLESAWVWSMRVEALAGMAGSSVPLGEAASSAQGDDAPRLRPLVDLVTVRAVAPLASLAEWATSLVRPGGHLLAFKGSRLAEEMSEWRRAPGPWEARGARSVTPEIQAVLLRRADRFT